MTNASYSTETIPYSRAWWLARLRSAFWVCAVTVLVWIYADAKLSEQKGFSAQVELTPAAGYVVDPPTRRAISFTLEGSRSAIEGFRERLAQGLVRILCDVGPRTRIPVKDILVANDAVTKAGLTVVSVSPEVLDVVVDTIATIPDVPIELDSKGATLGDVVVTPARTTIQVPQKAWEEIQRKLTAPDKKPSLKTKLQDLTGKAPGTTVKLADLQVVPSIEGVPVTPDVKTVNVSVPIRQRATVKPFTVTVRALTPPVWATDGTWQDYVLEGKNGSSEWRKTVNVAGSNTDLEKLKPEDIDAYFPLREQHKTRSETFDQEKVLITFPEGLGLKLDGPAPTVEFKLRKRTDLVPPSP